MQSQKSEEFKIVDIMRMIMAVFVVILHANIFKADGTRLESYINGVFIQLAVPFFFVVSGFFFSKKFFLENGNTERIKTIQRQFCKKLLPPLIMWGVWISG